MTYYVFHEYGGVKFASIKDARVFAIYKLDLGKKFDNLRVSNGWHPCIIVSTHVTPGKGEPMVVLFNGKHLWYEGHGKLSARNMRTILPDGSLARRS